MDTIYYTIEQMLSTAFDIEDIIYVHVLQIDDRSYR